MSPTMNSMFPVILSQFISGAPVLLVLMAGMVIVGARWRRAPRAAMLAMAGLGLMLLVGVAGPIVQTVILANRGPRPPANFAQTLTILAFTTSLLRAAGLGLLVAAVFAERRRLAEGFSVNPASPSPPPPMAGLANPSRHR